MRIIEVVAPEGHRESIMAIAEKQALPDYWSGPVDENGRQALRLLVAADKQQAVLDALQQLFGSSEDTRVVVIPVDVTLPRPTASESEATPTSAITVSREKLYHDAERGARLDQNYLLLVMLSTIVAAVGLLENNVAVVIGAMVIAPLLGPNIALALGTSLGDRELMWQALKSNICGIGLAIALAFVIGQLWPLQHLEGELLARTDVNLAGVALALSSGAAGVLSLTTGLPSVLVGVRVAVALRPPAATLGLMLGSGHYGHAVGAGLLLGVNIVCVNLAAKLVFLVKGVRPRTWLEKRQARQSVAAYSAIWVVSLLLLLAAIYYWHSYYTPPSAF
ncbi:MAG: TIGR00341 family protein [Gammaproteobacteria bacterium]|nr:TIGR00341 family protein [Gammaproteobacteria bacterium]